MRREREIDAPVASSGRRSAGAHLAAVAVVGVLAYANSFGVPFQFDDGNNIVDNPSVRNLGAFLREGAAAARAVGFFTFALNGSIHGHSVAGYHVVNLLIHLAVAACAYLLTVLACRRVAPPDDALWRNAQPAGLVAALLFVAHPVHTQAVTYIVQRFAALSTLFFVGAVIAYSHSADARSSARRLALELLALALGTSALFTKENTVTLPVVLLAVELLLLRGGWRDRVRRLAPFVIITAVSVAAFLLPAGAIEGVEREFRSGRPAGMPAWAAYLSIQPHVVLSYLRLLAMPTGQNVDHDPQPIALGVPADLALSLVALAMVVGGPAVVAWRARRRSAIARVVLLGIAWFAIALSVESSVIPLSDAMVEHRLYLPSVGLFMAGGAVAVRAYVRLSSGRRALAVAALGVTIAGLAFGTIARNHVWRTRLSLWSDALVKSPGKSRPYVYVAQDHLDRGDTSAAIDLLERAARLRDPIPHVFLNLGLAYTRSGQPVRAERAFREGIARGGASLPGAHSGLGVVLLELGRVPEACQEFEAAMSVESSREVRDNVAGCRFVRGDVRGAASEWAKLADEDGHDAPILYNLGLALAALGDKERAAGAFRKFLAVAAAPGLGAQRAEAERWLGAYAGEAGR